MKGFPIRGGSLALGLVAAAFAAGCSNEPPTSMTPIQPQQPASAPAYDGYIVVFKPGTDMSAGREGLMKAAGTSTFQIRSEIKSIQAVAVNGAVSPAVLRAAPGVQTVLKNYIASYSEPRPTVWEAAGTDQSGAFFYANYRQWGYRKINVQPTWTGSPAGFGAKVCVIDSGIDFLHQEFQGKVAGSTSFIPNDESNPGAGMSTAQDSDFHGSHVSGTISTVGVAAASVAPDAKILTAKVFNQFGGGATTERIINAIAWCTDNGADVINMSLGFTGGFPRNCPDPAFGPEDTCPYFIQTFQKGVNYAREKGVVVVASAGNDAMQMPDPAGQVIFLPAELVGVLAVGATGPYGANEFYPASYVTPDAGFDNMASYSNYGTAPSLDVFAPGGDFPNNNSSAGLILSVCSSTTNFGSTPGAGPFFCAGGNFYISAGGTSMASPHVAGLAAVLRSRFGSMARSPQLRGRIEGCITSRKLTDNIGPSTTFGNGRINAGKSVFSPC